MAEGLSANRFAEYLSLGQLPEPGAQTEMWVAPGDELFAAADSDDEHAAVSEPEPSLELTHEDQPEIAGTLRTPRRWEWMLVEAAVIGGDPERWRRRAPSCCCLPTPFSPLGTTSVAALLSGCD